MARIDYILKKEKEQRFNDIAKMDFFDEVGRDLQQRHRRQFNRVQLFVE